MYFSRFFPAKASVLAFSAILGVFSQQTNAAEPSHLEHPHSAGTFMVEAMYMRMNMDGLRAGTSDVSTSAATGIGGQYNHSMVPTEMTMDMFMLMPMYNFTKDTSVMLMFNYLDNNMGMTSIGQNNGDPCGSDMSTSGIGDTQISLSHKFLDDEFAASLELNVPTGSVSERTTMKMLMGGRMCHDHDMVAPYAMQLGSGTYDVTPSITYLGAYYSWRYGAQLGYKLRTGENDSGYTLGDEAKAKLWIRKPVFGITLSGELDIKRWGSIDGKNKELDEMLNDANMIVTTPNPNAGGIPTTMKFAPTLYPENYGGTLAELNINAKIPVSMAYIIGELTFPLYQDLNGLQMKRSISYTLSLGAMF